MVLGERLREGANLRWKDSTPVFQMGLAERALLHQLQNRLSKFF